MLFGRSNHNRSDRLRQLATVTEALLDIVFVLDLSQQFINVAGRALGQLNLSLDACAGRTLRQLVGPQAATPHEAANRRVLAGETATYELALPSEDGTRILRVTSCPHRDSRGNVVGVLGVGIDITAGRMSAAELGAVSSRLEAMVDSAPLAIVSMDLDGIVQSWNPAAEQVFGWTEQEVIGRSNPIIASGNEREVREITQQLAAGRSLTNRVLVRRRKDGSRVDLRASMAPIYDRHGDITGLLAIMGDVTEQRRIEHELHRYHVLARHSPDAILFTNSQGEIIDANPAALSMYGYPREELLGRPMGELVAGTLSSHRSGHGTLQIPQHRRRDGTVFPVEVNVTNTPADEGEPGEELTVYVVRDVTEHARRERVEELLSWIDRQVLLDEPMGSVIQQACERLADIYGFSLICVGLKKEDGSVGLAGGAGPKWSILERAVVRWDDSPLGRGPVGTAVRTGTVQQGRVSETPSLSAWRELIDEAGLQSYVAVPLATVDETVGAIAVYCAEADALDKTTIGRLQGLAQQLSISIREARRQELISLQNTALNTAMHAVVITDPSGAVEWVNPAYERLTQHSPADLRGKPLPGLRSGPHNDAFYRRLWRRVTRGEVWHRETQNRRKDGSLYIENQVITPMLGSDGSITHLVVIKEDITEKKRREEEIQYLATYDWLTGLPNRRQLETHLERACNRALRGIRSVLMLLDLDDFKVLNDGAGHREGDRLLVALAGVLRETLRPGDILARPGGDEFAVVLEDTDVDEAMTIAQALCNAVSDFRFDAGGRTYRPGVSIGVAQIDGKVPVTSMLSLAELALYEAKDQGKNRALLYDPSRQLPRRSSRESRVAADIREALAADGFVLHFQPIIELETGMARYYEALIRMLDAERRLHPPADFLDVAERFNLAPRIDLWVLERVLDMLRSRRDLHLVMNVSGSTLGDPQVLDRMTESVRSAAAVANRLGFEVTENVVVTDIDRLHVWMRRLRSLGCRFLVDDFGSGFSSFVYLRNLPFDAVKLDGSLVHKLEASPSDRAVVEAMTTIAHTLGKEVIAEWVETAGTVKVLRELGIEYGQGFFWAAPGPEIFSEVLQWPRSP